MIVLRTWKYRSLYRLSLDVNQRIAVDRAFVNYHNGHLRKRYKCTFILIRNKIKYVYQYHAQNIFIEYSLTRSSNTTRVARRIEQITAHNLKTGANLKAHGIEVRNDLSTSPWDDSVYYYILIRYKFPLYITFDCDRLTYMQKVWCTSKIEVLGSERRRGGCAEFDITIDIRFKRTSWLSTSQGVWIFELQSTPCV